MEIKAFFNTLIKNSLWILIISCIGGVLGILAYFYYPNKWSSTGSFYVTRTTSSEVQTYYDYDGYYSQQTALSYANTFLGFLESIDIRKKALENLNIEVNENSLRKFGRLIRAKKAAPQLINLEVKGETPQEAEALWKAVATNTLQTAEELNKTSDNMIRISQLTPEPVVKEAFRNIYLFFVLGFAAGLAIAIFFITLFKTNNE